MESHRGSLETTIDLKENRVLNPDAFGGYGGMASAPVALVVLAAGRGTRFGALPKCAQPVRGTPLARHSINAFRRLGPAPCVCVVGHLREEVMAALGGDPVYVQTSDPAGGTALAVYESLSIPGWLESNPLLVITMGDRIVPDSVFRKLLDTHRRDGREADLTLLSAFYAPPAQHGKGRILRDAAGGILRIVEQRDIDALSDPIRRRRLDDLVEGNCPLYAARARTLQRFLAPLRNDNAQGQFYLTDLVEALARAGGEVRSISTRESDPEYVLLCSDVTRPADLARLESIVTESNPDSADDDSSVRAAAEALSADRSPAQTESIACQLQELLEAAGREESGFQDRSPVAIGVSGGRFRIAFMHPDMGRFYGPAWQMPTGAADGRGREQIVLLTQASMDGQIHHIPTEAEFQEKISAVPADHPGMYPTGEIDDVYKYEEFGTRMAEQVLLSLGYFSDAEIQARKKAGLPLPPAALWIGNSMRRPFSLICNAIASLRTLRNGPIGERIQQALGREHFRGLRIATTGAIPRGGFSSSSALTVAVKNALNVLFGLGLPADTLVHLASQAEYGTGVRAGSLDQATEQKGKHGQGALISSNPRDNYRILGVYPVPTDRIRFLFPFSVDRDREAWKWSAGVYAPSPDTETPTTAEIRKLTGKVAEICAVLCSLPPDTDFFMWMEEDLVREGVPGEESLRKVRNLLRQIPLRITRQDLQARIEERRESWAEQQAAFLSIPVSEARARADSSLSALFTGWRDPRILRSRPDGTTFSETGVPLRAMLAYLFVECARNFQLIHHPDRWIEQVSRSQRGDCCWAIDPARLPEGPDLLRNADWELGLSGPECLNEWLRRTGAVPFDFNLDLEDESLDTRPMKPLHEIRGGNFFRGLALLDLAEAMLRRAFGREAVAVRVNAAGQGDYFQVHVDRTLADPEAVKDFIRRAFYRRFGLAPRPLFVEPHPGGGAVGVRLDRFDQLPALMDRLRRRATPTDETDARPPEGA
ncbi:MAG: NTP transferase domain-containing protein [Kiritimatiellia bacterium]|nr:NTP transferase domain-containing protein [Kiritimatiellia bacterium]